MRPSLNLDAMVDHSWVTIINSNICASARQWYELKAAGGYYQDKLTFENATTGLPTQLPASVYAQTVLPISGAGTYCVRWSGDATVNLAFFEGGGSGSAIGAFSAVHDGASTQALLTITAINPANPITGLSVCRIEDDSSGKMLSAVFRGLMATIRPKCLRLLDMFSPNTTRDTLETWAQRRPDGWWTQSNEYLSVRTIPAVEWVDGDPPALGDEVTWAGGSGVLVRTSSPVAGSIGHLSLGDSLPGVDTILSCPATGAIATLNDQMVIWQPRLVGPSVKWVRDFCAEAKTEFGLEAIWLSTHMAADDTYHTNFAIAMRDDGRLSGLKKIVGYINETWNSGGSFNRTWAYCNTRGTALGLPGAGNGAHYQGAQFYALRQNQVHNLWRAVFVSREAEIVRVFEGQNSEGEHWYQWRTIADPEEEQGPASPYPIDAWAVAPYPGQLGEAGAPYNTAAWWVGATDQMIYDFLVGLEIPKWVTAAPTGSAPYRGLGLNNHAIYAAERGCALWAYEWNFHPTTLEGSSAMTDRLRLWFRTESCRLAFRVLYLALQQFGVDVGCVYDFNHVGGSSGFWGVMETPFDGTANDPRWLVLVEFSGVSGGGGGGGGNGGGGSNVAVPVNPVDMLDFIRVPRPGGR